MNWHCWNSATLSADVDDGDNHGADETRPKDSCNSNGGNKEAKITAKVATRGLRIDVKERIYKGAREATIQ